MRRAWIALEMREGTLPVQKKGCRRGAGWAREAGRDAAYPSVVGGGPKSAA